MKGCSIKRQTQTHHGDSGFAGHGRAAACRGHGGGGGCGHGLGIAGRMCGARAVDRRIVEIVVCVLMGSHILSVCMYPIQCQVVRRYSRTTAYRARRSSSLSGINTTITHTAGWPNWALASSSWTSGHGSSVCVRYMSTVRGQDTFELDTIPLF